MTNFLRWKPGRQNGVKYTKMLLWSFKLFKWGFDAYILKYEPSTALPLHTDPVPNGKHYRTNITLKGKALFYCATESDTFDVSDKKVNTFRPDLLPHSLLVSGEGCTKLSLGFVKFKK